MVSCGSKVVMWVLTIFNFLWLIFAGFFIYIGLKLFSWNHDFKELEEMANVNLKNIGTVILVVAVIVAFIAFLGCYGACCENVCALTVYAVLILVLIGLEGYVLVISKRNEVDVTGKFENATIKAIHEIKGNNKTALLLERFQYSFQCCGWNGPADYVRINETIPGSCCGTNPTPVKGYVPVSCTLSSSELKSAIGCKEKLKVKDLVALFGTSMGLCIVVMMFEIIIVLAACCLAREVQLENPN